MTPEDKLDIRECLDTLDQDYKAMCYGAPQDVAVVPLAVELKAMKRDFFARAVPTFLYEVRDRAAQPSRKVVTIEVRRGLTTLIQATGISFFNAMHGAKLKLEGLS